MCKALYIHYLIFTPNTVFLFSRWGYWCSESLNNLLTLILLTGIRDKLVSNFIRLQRPRYVIRTMMIISDVNTTIFFKQILQCYWPMDVSIILILKELLQTPFFWPLLFFHKSHNNKLLKQSWQKKGHLKRSLIYGNTPEFHQIALV